MPEPKFIWGKKPDFTHYTKGTHMPIQGTKSWETIKAVLRYGILWLPVALEAMNKYETGGLVVALSFALTALDKYIHLTDNGVFKKFRGLLPF